MVHYSDYNIKNYVWSGAKSDHNPIVDYAELS